MMYGQMTAGSWIYIGSQGIVQGTYETFGAVARTAFRRLARRPARRHRGARRHGRRAAAGGDDERRRHPRRRGGRVAHRQAAGDGLLRPRRPGRSTRRSRMDREARGARAGALGRAGGQCAPTCCRELVRRGIVPDVLTDQTSAHDTLQRLRPRRHDAGRRGARCASAIRGRTCAVAPRRPCGTCGRCSRCSARGAVTFDYGNNIRTEALDAGVHRCIRDSRLRPGVHPAAVLRGEGAVPLGGALGRSGGHRAHRRAGARAVPARRAPAALDHAGARARSTSRDCRRASAGWARASARGSASR